VRRAFYKHGVTHKEILGGDGYVEFANIYRALSSELSMSFWDFEHLCAHLADDSGGTALVHRSRDAIKHPAM
jgi:hypothetical protein